MQRDVVLRWIEQIVATVRRMLLGPGAVDPAFILSRVDEAIEQLLGPLTLLVPRLDAVSAAGLLRDPERILGYARLLALRALVLERMDNPSEAALARERALVFEASVGACPQCGGTHLDPAHSCPERFQLLLALDHSRKEPWGSRHGIVFACYHLQHPAQEPAVLERSWLVLHRLVVARDDPARLFDALRRDAPVRPEDWNAPPLPSPPAPGGPYAITIADLGDFTSPEYPAQVEDWALATYQRWASSRPG